MFVIDHLDNDEEKKVAVYHAAVFTLLELPKNMADLQIYNRPDPTKLKDVNWSFAAICCTMRHINQDEIAFFIQQVLIYISHHRSPVDLLYSPPPTDTT